MRVEDFILYRTIKRELVISYYIIMVFFRSRWITIHLVMTKCVDKWLKFIVFFKFSNLFLKENFWFKVELWPGCRFYVHTLDYGFIKKSATFNGQISWGTLVTNMLMEVYGRNIVHYSATGHRLCKSPGIDKRLYRGLWCKKWW